MFARLAISEAGRPARSVAVGDAATIGRNAENDIVLEAATVSRYHALLLRDAAGLLLVDLESTNGTLHNGVLVRPDEPVRLADGDVIQLGEVVARYAAPLECPRPAALWTATAQRSSTCWTPCDR